YPVEFYCALLSLHMDERDKIMQYLGHCRTQDIQVLPPDVNESDVSFTVTNGVIRFGFAGIKDVGEKVSSAVLKARKDGPFKDIIDFYQRTKLHGVNKRTIEALAKAGVFDSLGVSRAGVLSVVEELVKHHTKMKAYNKKMETYRKRLERYTEREYDRKEKIQAGQKPKPSLKKPVEPQLPPPVQIPEVEEMELDELLRQEKETLGLYITSHPLYNYELEILKLTDAHTGSLADHSHGEYVTLLGLISSIRHIKTKKGSHMAVLDLEDLHGHVQATVFPGLYLHHKHLLEESKVILLSGRVEEVDETNRRLIALKIESLPEKVTKTEEPPSQVDVHVSQLDDKLTEQIEDVVDCHPGELDTRATFDLNGATYRLKKTAKISKKGALKLKRLPQVEVKVK
ncbi:MAG: OB-fold nucleic acid binding domain-containing protein, partial [Candidatus Bathyarchaeota archaeon]|nr:OB-fold nucleic acid binding domain-containing protein [Candidatus Bathyarchaeota archaeon]